VVGPEPACVNTADTGANDEVGQAYLERETITDLGWDLPSSDRFLISRLHTPLAKFTREMQAAAFRRTP
jgi:hypothetical protein